jgi:arginine deiminase
MNAKITITVPMDQIPKKLCYMFDDVAKELDNTAIDTTAVAKACIQESDFLKQMEEIDKIRKKLSLLDANLEDCYNIISGLVLFKTKQQEKEQHDVKRTQEG